MTEPKFKIPKVRSLVGVSKKFNLTSDDIKHRSKSFVDEKSLKLHGVRRVDDDVGHELLTYSFRGQKSFGGIYIPYLDIYSDVSESIRTFTLRRDNPDIELIEGKKKEKQKYKKPSGQNHAYFTNGIDIEYIKKPNQHFVLFEGEFKAIAGARCATKNWTEDYSFIPLGISGVDNFKTKRAYISEFGGKEKHSGQLIDFDYVDFKTAKFTIVYDSDIDEKPNVKSARNRLMYFLRQRKAKVFVLDLPKLFNEEETKGFDDYAGAIEAEHGTDEAIKECLRLLSKAESPKKTLTASADNFELIENGETEAPGVYYSDAVERYRICSSLKITAETQTSQGEGCGRLLEWRGRNGRKHSWAMPIKLIHSDGLEIARFLSDKELEIYPSRKHREKLSLYISSARTDRFLISTEKVGWNNDCFVFPDETIGLFNDGENEVIFQNEFAGHFNFNTSGTLSDWQENISKYCRNNSRLLLGVSVAFASALLAPLEMQGAGLHFWGKSSTGKTTVLNVGGSVWGGGGEQGFLKTWKATANGLEVVAASHNHALLCLDELGECSAREVGKIIYMISNGQGKMRMNKSLDARKPLSWRLMYLSNGELTIEDKLFEAGQIIKAGQEVRLCSIEADTNNFGVFEDLHDFENGGLLSDHLRESAKKYYGTPSRSFVKFLTDCDLVSVKKDWHNFKDTYLKSLNLYDRPPEVMRVAVTFAFVAFSGELATQASITKWDEREAIESSQLVFNEWLNSRTGTGQSDTEKGIRQVISFLQKYENRFEDLNFDAPQNIPDRAGYKETNETLDRIDFYIFQEAFKKDICKGFNAKAIKSYLADKGILKKSSDNKYCVNKRIKGNQKRLIKITSEIFRLEEGSEVKEIESDFHGTEEMANNATV